MGAIQGAVNTMIGTGAAAAVGAKKLHENERQAREKKSAEVKAQEQAKAAEESLKQEAKETALEADLVRMGADPESARAFMDARSLGLSTKGFGMIRNKGKFAGSYSTMAERLSKDALTDSLSSKVINKQGFAERVISLSGTRKGRVEALVKASGGKK